MMLGPSLCCDGVMYAGQAVVQMVMDTRTKEQLAIKFFLSSGALLQYSDIVWMTCRLHMQTYTKLSCGDYLTG
jgi:hypothetical protein